MKKILFCDSSVNPQMGIGFGAYLLLDELSLEIDKNQIQTKLFENTSSSKLELENLLWALESLDENITKLDIYTDCQNIITLKDRKEKLEKNDYKSSTNKIIKNHKEYKKFFSLISKYEISFYKIKGHKKKALKDTNDKIFSFLDKTSRKKLRQYIKNL